MIQLYQYVLCFAPILTYTRYIIVHIYIYKSELCFCSKQNLKLTESNSALFLTVHGSRAVDPILAVTVSGVTSKTGCGSE